MGRDGPKECSLIILLAHLPLVMFGVKYDFKEIIIFMTN